MSGHAQLPWRYQAEVTIDPPRRDRLEFHIYTATGKFGSPAVCDRESDAEFIVRACNNHDALLAAVKGLLPEGWGDGHMDHMPGVRAARLAIAAAESLTSAQPSNVEPER